MTIRRSNIFLYREDDIYGSVFVDINNCKTKLASIIDNRSELKQRIIIDLCFLSFLGGNDFIPAIIQFKIRDNGLDNLIKIYIEYRKRNKFIISLLNKIETTEFYEFCKIAELYEDSMVLYIKNKPIFNKASYFYNVSLEIEDYNHRSFKTDFINYTNPNWKDDYKNMYLHDTSFIDYLYAIYWCWEYYNGNIISCDYHYKIHHAPYISGITKYIHLLNTIPFEKNSPLTPSQQLTAILPPACKYLVSNKHKKAFKNINLYPSDFNMLFDSKMIYSVPILPPLDLDFIRSFA